jgi:hypothetical protein
MTEKTIAVHMGRASEANPGGLAAEGTYTEADGVVTLIKFNGEALSADKRKIYTRKLNEGDKPRMIAGRLTKDYAFSIHTNRPFSAPLNYPPIKVA